MSEQTPKRLLAAAIASGLLIAGLGLVVFSGLQLAAAPISLLLVLWLSLPLLGLPVAFWSAFHLYGLLTAVYRIDRDGFAMRWGMARETAPLQQVQSVEAVSSADLARPAGLPMPGFLLGSVSGSDRRFEYFAVEADRLIAVELPDITLIISPSNPAAFIEAFVVAIQMGSLEPLRSQSRRSNLLTARLWRDKLARWLLLAGLLLPLALIGYLGVGAGQLPGQVHFGFMVNGSPGPLAPPGRLLLLPLMNGLVWVVNLLLGSWLYTDEIQRPLAYGLWGLSILVGGLLFGAVLQMLGASI